MVESWKKELTLDSRRIAIKKAKARVSVVIVTYKSTGELPGCLDSLLKQVLPIEIFMVDNASPDETPRMVLDYAARHDHIHAILNRENIGLAAGNNMPLGKCEGDYVLMLNPDTILCDGSLQQMVDFLDQNPDVGVVGPKNLYEDGTPHVSAHRNWGLLHVLAWRVAPYRLTRGLYNRLSAYEVQDALFVSGACLMIRRTIFEELGGYDPEYFLTAEDACDLCIRVRQSGYRVVFLSDTKVFHFTGRSAVQVPYIVVWHGNQGTVYHFLKHKGVLQAFIVSLLLITAAAARVIIALIAGIVTKRYRDVARVYASVLWGLVVRNPILVNGGRRHEPVRHMVLEPGWKQDIPKQAQSTRWESPRDEAPVSSDSVGQ